MKKETEEAHQHLQGITLLLDQLDDREDEDARAVRASVAEALRRIEWLLEVVLREGAS